MGPYRHRLLEHCCHVKEAVIHIDNLSELFATVVHMYAISEAAGIAVAVVIVPEMNIVDVIVVVDHTVLVDSFHYIAYAYLMVVAVEVLHDLNNCDEVALFAVADNEFVVDETFHFDYLIPVCSASLLFVVKLVLLQCYLDYSTVDEPLMTPVAAAASVAIVFVDTIPVKNFDDDSVDMEFGRYFDGFVRTELVRYFDELTDTEPAIHLVDKISMSCVNDSAVPNSWHNYCTLECDSFHNSLHGYD